MNEAFFYLFCTFQSLCKRLDGAQKSGGHGRPAEAPEHPEDEHVLEPGHEADGGVLISHSTVCAAQS